jgi:hypothetical protein
MLIIQKNFNSDPNDPKSFIGGMTSQFNDWQKQREDEAAARKYFEANVGRKPHEITATYASDPAKKDEMREAHVKHTREEEQEKLNEAIRNFDAGKWFKEVTSKDKSKGPQPEETKIDSAPVKDQPAVEYKPEP